jgi:hypothetical protein
MKSAGMYHCKRPHEISRIYSFIKYCCFLANINSYAEYSLSISENIQHQVKPAIAAWPKDSLAMWELPISKSIKSLEWECGWYYYP